MKLALLFALAATCLCVAEHVTENSIDMSADVSKQLDGQNRVMMARLARENAQAENQEPLSNWKRIIRKRTRRDIEQSVQKNDVDGKAMQKELRDRKAGNQHGFWWIALHGR